MQLGKTGVLHIVMQKKGHCNQCTITRTYLFLHKFWFFSTIYYFGNWAFIAQCTITRTYLFLHKFWFFSTIYYFGNWAFIAFFLIGLVVSCCKGKKSVIEGEVEEDDSDMSDDEFLQV
ncbi:putative lysosomal cobalamin transporter [Acipenser ruthenus]|uniref:Putative lysosomal cobalamin transporter n=1 Tax=Acipenser ruthenus TaxID=7906 RepID=A0A444UFU4_ACIRT|nr:putative lysosomal cobalamin transporter [Acipenser ruthenus]